MRDSRHHGPSFPWSSTHPHHWDPPHHLLHKHHIRQEQINYLLSYLTTQANSQSKNRKQHTAMTKTSHGRQCVDFRGNRQIDAVIHICTVAKANDQSTHLHTHTHTHTHIHTPITFGLLNVLLMTAVLSPRECVFSHMVFCYNRSFLFRFTRIYLVPFANCFVDDLYILFLFYWFDVSFLNSRIYHCKYFIENLYAL